MPRAARAVIIPDKNFIIRFRDSNADDIQHGFAVTIWADGHTDILGRFAVSIDWDLTMIPEIAGLPDAKRAILLPGIDPVGF